jgi:hypothetical protein
MDLAGPFLLHRKQRGDEVSAEHKEERYRELCAIGKAVSECDVFRHAVCGGQREGVMQEDAKEGKETHRVQLWPIEIWLRGIGSQWPRYTIAHPDSPFIETANKRRRNSV